MGGSNWLTFEGYCLDHLHQGSHVLSYLHNKSELSIFFFISLNFFDSLNIFLLYMLYICYISGAQRYLFLLTLFTVRLISPSLSLESLCFLKCMSNRVTFSKLKIKFNLFGYIILLLLSICGDYLILANLSIWPFPVIELKFIMPPNDTLIPNIIVWRGGHQSDCK